jgi:hypothetical protein
MSQKTGESSLNRARDMDALMEVLNHLLETNGLKSGIATADVMTATGRSVRDR